MKVLSALIAGLVFGLGLVISGMANPAKVQNFLDLFGTWDPSLAFVMGGAIAIALPGFRLVGRRVKPLFADVFQIPSKTDLDPRLLTGASIFGIGWGMSGFCPGPAITAISLMNSATLVFVVAMVVGMGLARFTGQRLSNPLAG